LLLLLVRPIAGVTAVHTAVGHGGAAAGAGEVAASAVVVVGAIAAAARGTTRSPRKRCEEGKDEDVGPGRKQSCRCCAGEFPRSTLDDHGGYCAECMENFPHLREHGAARYKRYKTGGVAEKGDATEVEEEEEEEEEAAEAAAAAPPASPVGAGADAFVPDGDTGGGGGADEDGGGWPGDFGAGDFDEAMAEEAADAVAGSDSDEPEPLLLSDDSSSDTDSDSGEEEEAGEGDERWEEEEAAAAAGAPPNVEPNEDGDAAEPNQRGGSEAEDDAEVLRTHAPKLWMDRRLYALHPHTDMMVRTYCWRAYISKILHQWTKAGFEEHLRNCKLAMPTNNLCPWTQEQVEWVLGFPVHCHHSSQLRDACIGPPTVAHKKTGVYPPRIPFAGCHLFFRQRNRDDKCSCCGTSRYLNADDLSIPLNKLM